MAGGEGGVVPSIALPLDHAVVLVEDLEVAGEGFQALGFTVTPESRHSLEMGTANRCVILAETYIELLSVVAPTERNARWRALLAERPEQAGGVLCGLALRSRDLEAERAAMADAGLPIGPVLSFSRKEPAGTLRFSVARLEAAATPGLQLFFCHHHTRALLWRPAWQTHANGARQLAGVGIAAGAGDVLMRSLRAVAAALPEAEASGKAGISLLPSGAAGRLLVTTAADMPRQGDLTETAGVVVELRPA
jgi:hypothetical protein